MHPSAGMFGKRLRVGVVELLAHSVHTPWARARIIAPATASVMPQVVAAWCEELGHDVQYGVWTSARDELSLAKIVPDDLDVVFISSFTRSAFLAYALSRYLRARGALTVLGGPHARSFAGDAVQHFDVVVGQTDKALVDEILRARPRASLGALGVVMASRAPTSLPPIASRARFVDACFAQSTLLRVVPMLASVGCPYTCNFCVDATEPWRPFASSSLVDDLTFIEKRWGSRTLVGWHDPNFGVRFDDVLGAIETSGTRLAHCAHMSLSLLGRDRVKRLSSSRFALVAPGVESWFDFSDKAGAKALSGRAKLDVVAPALDQVARHVHHVQTNFIVGLDGEELAASTALTKDCLQRAPGITPTFFQVTNFYNAPLSSELHARTLPVPYSLLDTNALGNVRPSAPLHGWSPMSNAPRATFVDVVDTLIALYAHAYAWPAIARRAANAHGHWGTTAAFARSVVDGRALLEGHRRLRRALEEDRGLRAFVEGDRRAPPELLMREAKRDVGRYSELLPDDTFDAERFVDAFFAKAPAPVVVSGAQPGPDVVTIGIGGDHKLSA